MNKVSKRFVAIAMGVVVSCATILVPIAQMTDAWATTTTLSFNFNASDPRVELESHNNNHELRAVVDDGNGRHDFGISVNDNSGGVGNSPIDSSRINVSCTSEQSCTVVVSGVELQDPGNDINPNYYVQFTVGHDTPIAFYDLTGTTQYDGRNLSEDTSFSVKYRDLSDQNSFNGNAYVIWACGEDDGEVCLHLISGITNENGETEYYQASDITDITDPTRKFDKFGKIEGDDGEIRGTAIKSDVDNWVKEYTGDENATVADFDWSQIDARTLLLGVPERIGGVKLQPLPDEIHGKSSYTSFGDRNFKIVIYDETTYKAIELGDLNDMQYVPYTMTDDVYLSAIDISDTSIEDPAVMDSLLIQNTVNFDASASGGLDIANVVALDVPSGAVAIQLENNRCAIRFNSNFYDGVVFEITDNLGGKYYLRINRSTIYPSINDRDGHYVYAKIFYDESRSYSDYEVMATYVYKDGSVVIKKMPNAGQINYNISDVASGYEMVGGKGLKMADYSIEEPAGFTDNLEGIYFNIRLAGTTDTKYAGTLAGSGIGYYVEVQNRR